MSSNLPPGVTGNEWEIAGYPNCGRTGCSHPEDEHAEYEVIGGVPVEPSPCSLCDCPDYTPYYEEN